MVINPTGQFGSTPEGPTPEDAHKLRTQLQQTLTMIASQVCGPGGLPWMLYCGMVDAFGMVYAQVVANGLKSVEPALQQAFKDGAVNNVRVWIEGHLEEQKPPSLIIPVGNMSSVKPETNGRGISN